MENIYSAYYKQIIKPRFMVLDNEKLLPTDDFLVRPNQKLILQETATEYEAGLLNKKQAEEMLDLGRKHLGELQDTLYAHSRYSVLILLQGMDASGKDGTVKHIMTGLNPQGVHVYSFKTPTVTELDHDYFWRHSLALPARGEIAIHNRSHYENVLITRVHPEYILKENIPGINNITDINDAFWEQRFRQIRRYEENLTDNGTVILKFFLHISKEEQKKRFMERLDDPAKNWKFSLGDLAERQHWDKYQSAFQEAITKTSTEHAPWFVIPADDKWFARLIIASIIYKQFSKLKLSYPELNEAELAKLAEAKKQLLAEPETKRKKKN